MAAIYEHKLCILLVRRVARIDAFLGHEFQVEIPVLNGAGLTFVSPHLYTGSP
ncbi:MAG: hypothetical protein ACOX35_03935 [Bacillota bacterium]